MADAWACTNPSAGRGISMGLVHSVALRDVIRRAGGNPLELARSFHEVTEAQLSPWYVDQIRADRTRYRAMDAQRQGHPPPEPAVDDYSRKARVFWRAMPFDADLYRAAVEIMSVMTLSRDVFARPGIIERAEMIVDQLPADRPTLPGPSRADLLKAISCPGTTHYSGPSAPSP